MIPARQFDIIATRRRPVKGEARKEPGGKGRSGEKTGSTSGRDKERGGERDGERCGREPGGRAEPPRVRGLEPDVGNEAGALPALEQRETGEAPEMTSCSFP